MRVTVVGLYVLVGIGVYAGASYAQQQPPLPPAASCSRGRLAVVKAT
jgi:hypothetical protein